MDHLYLVSYPYESSQAHEKPQRPSLRQRGSSRTTLRPDSLPSQAHGKAQRPSLKQRTSTRTSLPRRESLQRRDSIQRYPRAPLPHNNNQPSATAAALANLAFNMRMRDTRGSFLIYQATKRSQPQSQTTKPPGNIARQGLLR